MMQVIADLWEKIVVACSTTLTSIIRTFGWNDLLDIVIVSYLIYKLIQIVRETRAAQLVKGIILLLVAAVLAEWLGLKTIQLLLSNIFQWGILALIVIFQPELRRVLEKAGQTKVASFNVFSSQQEDEDLRTKWIHTIDMIGTAAEDLSRTKTGALIVFERKTRLGEQISTGVVVNADVSPELIGNLFFHNSPLHDGAVIIRDARILAASCFLPKPIKEELIARELGARHRAAIGMSENSDALILVVSEETGAISIAENGVLTRNYTKDSLCRYLRRSLISETPEEGKDRKSKFWKVKRK